MLDLVSQSAAMLRSCDTILILSLAVVLDAVAGVTPHEEAKHLAGARVLPFDKLERGVVDFTRRVFNHPHV